MAEQAVDLRSALAVWSRHRILLGVAAVLGAAIGAGLVHFVPPHYTSTSQVLLPIAETISESDGRDSATEIEIASSDVVFGPAGKAVAPRLTASQVNRLTEVTAPSNDVIAFRVDARSAREAEGLAQALADAEVAYSNGTAGSLASARSAALLERRNTLQKSLDAVTREIDVTTRRKATEPATSTAGRADAVALAGLTAQQADLALQLDSVKSQLMDGQDSQTARVIQRATPATARKVALRYTLYVAGGIAAAMFLMSLVLLLVGRHDRRLRSRDEMADALGCSVVASVRARRPRSVAAWGRLLSSYSPDTVDAWALRQVLHRVRPSAAGGRGGAPPPSASTILIVLSDDPGGLAMAPQLASYAAATGVPTRFVACGRHESAAALWAATSHEADATEPREGLWVGAEADDAELTVALVVVDRKNPEGDDLRAARAVAADDEQTTILVALAAGSATGQELARAAVLLDDQDLRIDGLVVADPDDLDRTTGRLAEGGRAAIPTHLAALPLGRSGSAAGTVRRPR